jgi:2-oxoglutarate dehydrogenase E2 component (dihydrolipoamide succinyltransferase)
MATDITVPTFPESVSDGTILAWRKQAGDSVSRGEIIADIETDKVVFEVPASSDGVIAEINAPVGATVVSGQVIGKLGAAGAAKATESKPAAKETKPAGVTPSVGAPTMPAARKLAAEHGLKTDEVEGGGRGGRVRKEDVVRHLEITNTRTAAPQAKQPEVKLTSVPTSPSAARAPSTIPMTAAEGRPQKRVPMTRLRQRIAERLVEAQRTAAILTTFNEVNMQPVMDLRSRYREQFEKEHGVKLGFMSFFVKASIEALKRFPEVNASIDGNDVVYHGFYDIGIAVGSPRGLVVPILRDADQRSTANIETTVKDFGERSKAGKLAIEEITGGTFTITNGGVFGSLMSTPILNPPQSAILGMHKIQERPMAENGQVVIRPMMYLALSYDHRLVDGREAVQFLVTIKEMIEDPARLLLEV